MTSSDRRPSLQSSQTIEGPQAFVVLDLVKVDVNVWRDDAEIFSCFFFCLSFVPFSLVEFPKMGRAVARQRLATAALFGKAHSGGGGGGGGDGGLLQDAGPCGNSHSLSLCRSFVGRITNYGFSESVGFMAGRSRRANQRPCLSRLQTGLGRRVS